MHQQTKYYTVIPNLARGGSSPQNVMEKGNFAAVQASLINLLLERILVKPLLVSGSDQSFTKQMPSNY